MLPHDTNINNEPTTPYRPIAPSAQGGATPPNPGAYRESPPQNWGAPQQAAAPDFSARPVQPQPGGFPPHQPHPAGRPTPPRRDRMRAGAIFLLAIVLLLVFGTGTFAGWVFAQNGLLLPGSAQNPNSSNNVSPTIPPLDNTNIESVRASVVANVRPAVVQINTTLRGGSGIGSGVIIDERGYIVTNNHVVDGARDIEVVLWDGTTLKGELIGTAPGDDLAVIKIEPPKNMVVAQLGNSSDVRVGQEVLAIGNPLGITQTVTNGIVSAVGRNVDVGDGVTIINAIQTDAPINPGNSGGALVDLQGKVIGIPTLTAVDTEFNAPANGVGFAIPSNRVNQIVPQLIENGEVTHSGRAALGIQATDVDAVVQQTQGLAVDYGVLIASVSSNGPAEQGGLQVGDVIVAFDNQEVRNTAALQDALSAHAPDDKVSLQIYRGNQQMTINVTLGEAQSN